MVRVTPAVAASLVVLGLVTPSAPPAVAGHHGDHHRRVGQHARAGIPVDRLRQPQFVSATRGYALVFHRDRADPGIAVTLDGGRRWTPRQHPSFGAASDRRISADALSLTVTRRRLLVWGPTGLFAARENGSRWHRAIADRVGQVDPVGSSVWATTWPCDRGTRCRGWLRVSHDFGRTWSKRAHLPRGVGPRGRVPRLVRATRRTAYLVRPELGRNGALAVTTDGGRSWAARPLPHRTEHEFTGFRPLAVGSDGALWLVVPGEPGAGSEAKAVYRSSDGGRAWSRVAVTDPPAPGRRANLPIAGYVSSLVAIDSDTSYLVQLRAGPLITTDGGASWHSIFDTDHIPQNTDFTTVWLDKLRGSRAWLWTNGSHHLWATRDGGRHWAPIASYPIRRHVPRCTSDQLRVWVRDSGSVMSQPYARIALRNVGSTACTVRGYPRITAWGVPVGDDDDDVVTRLTLDVRPGAFYEARDRGPQRIGLRPGSRAVFSVGTGTAYSARLMEIQRLDVELPGTGGVFGVPLGLYATAPPGKRIPVAVTAIDWRVR
jgi:photosystem II stability/assembly factor-like uncharacterized protein